jgi:hypothetical protein
MDAAFLAAIQLELAERYGVYELTATEARLVRLPRQTHRSRGSPLPVYDVLPAPAPRPAWLRHAVSLTRRIRAL